ncbi:hypothetical protein I6A84_08195, partial [Frankia sp. CNm7]|nr:hypothetical protein [Frankia nepalensis]
MVTGFTYANGAFTLDWSPASYAGGYEAELRSPTGAILRTASLGLADRPLRLVHQAAATSLPVGTYVGQARAVRGDQQSAWAPASLTKAPTPGATLAYSAGSLVATWAAVAGAAYEVAFVDPAGASIATRTDVRAGTVSVPLDDPREGAYSARVRPLGGDIPADWSAPAAATALTMPAPAGLVVRAAGGALTVTFPSVANAAEYLAEVTAVAVTTVTPVTTVTGPAGAASAPVTLTLPAPAGRPYAAGTTYGVRIRARRPDAVGAWSTRATIVYDTAPGWSLSLRNDLTAAPPPAGPDDGVLRALVTTPTGVGGGGGGGGGGARGGRRARPPAPRGAPGEGPPGATGTRGAGGAGATVAAVEIIRSLPRAPGLRDATRYRVSALTRGGAVTLSFGAIAAGTAAGTDFGVGRTRGFLFGTAALWADTVADRAMASRLFDVLTDTVAVAAALRSAYDGLDSTAITPPLLAAIRDPATLPRGIVAPAAPALTASGTVVPLLTNYFGSANAQLGLAAALLVAGQGLGATPTRTAAELLPLGQAAFTVSAGMV